MKRQDLQDDSLQEGDIIVVKISRVLNYGAFADLLEFKGLTGFIHVSNVASGWVKNIRNLVKENQIRAAKVLSVNMHKHEVELSLAKVSKNLEKQRIDEFNQSVRIRKLLEVLAKQEKKTFDFVWENIAVPLTDEYGDLNEALKEVALNKEGALPSSIPKSLINPLLDLVGKNISIPEKLIRAELTVSCLDGDGVLKIKGFLKAVLREFSKVKLSVYYKGSGKYAVDIKALNFKNAEKILREFQEVTAGKAKQFHLTINAQRIKE